MKSTARNKQQHSTDIYPAPHNLCNIYKYTTSRIVIRKLKIKCEVHSFEAVGVLISI